MTSNEIRQIVGMKPSDDPKADELRNSNISEPSGQSEENNTSAEVDNFIEKNKEEIQNEV